MILVLVLEGKKERKRKAQDKLKEVEEGLKPPPPKRYEFLRQKFTKFNVSENLFFADISDFTVILLNESV